MYTLLIVGLAYVAGAVTAVVLMDAYVMPTTHRYYEEV